MGTIQELPALERPREKAYRYGIETLSDQELITLLIGSGYRGINARELAEKLLSSNNGLLGLSNTHSEILKKEKGIKKAKAISLCAAFEIHRRLNKRIEEQNENKITAEYLYNKYKDELYHESQEVLILIMLDGHRHIISEKEVYRGTSSDVPFSYHEIWRYLYTYKAKSYYLIHNHPDGDEKPSRKDLILTQEIFRESKRINIPLIDHIIIGENNYYSFQK